MIVCSGVLILAQGIATIKRYASHLFIYPHVGSLVLAIYPSFQILNLVKADPVIHACTHQHSLVQLVSDHDAICDEVFVSSSFYELSSVHINHYQVVFIRHNSQEITLRT